MIPGLIDRNGPIDPKDRIALIGEDHRAAPVIENFPAGGRTEGLDRGKTGHPAAESK
jgi:hypothetical protein